MFYLFIISAATLLALLVSLPLWHISRQRNGYLFTVRRLALMGLTGTVIIILYATIFWSFPFQFTDYHRLNLQPFIWTVETYSMGSARMAAHLILNFFMFLPFGLLLPIAFRRMRRFYVTVPISLGLTLSIETFQYFIGRAADIDDVIMNGSGALCGYLLFAFCSLLFARTVWWQKALGYAPKPSVPLSQPLFTD